MKTIDDVQPIVLGRGINVMEFGVEVVEVGAIDLAAEGFVSFSARHQQSMMMLAC